MLTMETTLVVNRPITEVWTYFEDPTNVPEWQGSVAEMHKNTDGPVGVGTRMTEVRNFLGKRMESTLEVTGYEPERKFDLQVIKGPIPFKIRHDFEPVDGGTRISFKGEGETGGFFKLAGPMVKRQAQKQSKADFERLKQILESR
jgi:ligand-binding SRPBCC domain-containing protein